VLDGGWGGGVNCRKVFVPGGLTPRY
jgi:hypothetical protein